jgi:chromosomal replication initiation ATPase DnaA
MDIEYGELTQPIKTGTMIPARLDGNQSGGCPNCGGGGSVYAFRITGGPYPSNFPTAILLDDANHPRGWYTTKIEAAFCPICRGNQIQQYLWKACGLEETDKQLSAEDFRILPGKQAAHLAMIDLLAMRKTPSGFVTFWGTFGVGKSMLLKILVNGFRTVGLIAKYISLADLLATAREKFGESAGSVENVIDYYRTLPVLAVDEVDRVNLTPWAMETTYRLLDSRFNSRGELLTVVACNLSPLQMPENLGYLASRMRGGLVVEVGGADLRPAVGMRERADIDG